MRIHLVVLGKTRRPEIRALLDDYLERIGRFADVQLTELREDSAASVRKLALDPAATIILLDDAGKPQTSAQFAEWLGETRDRGAREIVFLCGGAEGFPEALRRRATQKFSLSRLTFSHELARAMLAEQLYRAFAILAGHPYPK
ncbi:MAG TPA: 23S rRNA (pseudouridine(1915)-N(3))-methyltransferase RlmH [Candidatus Acidoferrales bacterium]|jgi:23S rRNA (pseudouridine1915-N3)-methyltransferase|nr:23S rRNA (pseudouridine(1915)-N(3))-methyltransferase RlmH [Candidatus Acidoferrales bacterium]